MKLLTLFFIFTFTFCINVVKSYVLIRQDFLEKDAYARIYKRGIEHSELDNKTVE
ncbi:14788_t:CDS:1, partial [Gigaspora rosea]